MCYVSIGSRQQLVNVCDISLSDEMRINDINKIDNEMTNKFARATGRNYIIGL